MVSHGVGSSLEWLRLVLGEVSCVCRPPNMSFLTLSNAEPVRPKLRRPRHLMLRHPLLEVRVGVQGETPGASLGLSKLAQSMLCFLVPPVWLTAY